MSLQSEPMAKLLRVCFEHFHDKTLVQFSGNHLYMGKRYFNCPISIVMEERKHNPHKRVGRLPMMALLLFGVVHIFWWTRKSVNMFQR